MKHADWYFDFISPFSYLQIEQFDRLPADLDVTLKPIVFAGLLTHHGHKGPAEIPRKRRFTYQHVVWLAARLGIPLRFPPAHPFNPIRLLRLALACGATLPAVRAIFRYVWRDGHTADDVEAFAALARALAVDDVEAAIGTPAVKDALRRHGDEAVAAGVFGVPSFVIDGEIFWGADSTDFFLDYVRNPAMLQSDEMTRVGNLPATSVRKPG